MVAEVVLSVMGNRSDRRFPNLSCPWALEAVWLTRRRRAHFHQGQEHTIKLLKQAEYMAATGFTPRPANYFRSGLGPYMGNRSDRRFPNLSCPWALEAVWLTRRRRAHFHQGQEHTIKLLKLSEYTAAT